jgi:Fusaric acid resistance protein-like
MSAYLVMKSNQHRNSQIAAVFFNGGMTFALCGLSYWLITHLLARVFSVSRDDDLLGGMWAVVATVFVFRNSCEQSVRAALLRMAATSLSFVLCFIYLLLFPFHFLGMAALVAIGAVVMSLLRRPDDIITTGITTTVVMVVAAMNPTDAWTQPILRTIDTIVGAAVGVLGGIIYSLAKAVPADEPGCGKATHV